ncbi:MAG: class I SAM-dependent rRNA methyltransferase [Chloroflexi bacterium]|nr:class I SAM-dependent rRNA methyltransferase [Chloroflexota bacterium]
MKKLKIDLPKISKKRIALRVTAAAERAIRSGHPWIFENAIVHQSHQGKSGDLAVIFDKKRHFLAIGLYDPDSMIRVRIIHALKPATVDKHFFAEKLNTAHQRRAPLRDSAHTNGYRILHGENDGMPGLVIDRYAETLVIKLYTAAWFPHLQDIVDATEKDFSAKRIVLRLSDRVKENPHKLYDGMLLFGEKPESPIIFKENGLNFEVDPLRGQKTGFFLDQRENRARVEKLAKGKRVLNAFSYTGGFSVYAARGGAKEVVSLDASKVATEVAKRNFGLNQPASIAESCIHESVTGDAFDAMSKMKKEGRLFDMVIIDPPSFAHKKSQRDGAINAYKKLTRIGLGILAPNGILVQASCSSRVDSDLFFNAINIATQQVGRRLKEIERSSHALDHPIDFHEGEYLKCLFATVP